MKHSNSKIIAVILAGGVGNRFGSEIPKQYVKINNKRIVDYTIEKFQTLVDEIIIACDPYYFDTFKQFHVVNSGQERFESLNNAMKYIKDNFGTDTVVLSHDSARPLINVNDIKKLIAAQKNDKIVTLAKKATSTFWSNKHTNIVNRDYLYEILTPQCVNVKTYFKNNKLTSECSDLCSYGKINDIEVDFVFSTSNNIKLTYPQDLHYFTYYLGENNG